MGVQILGGDDEFGVIERSLCGVGAWALAHLAHAGAVVNNKSRNLVLRHLCFESVCLVAARGAGRERR